MRVLTTLYFLLLSYMIVSLIFWGHSLDNQSTVIAKNETALLAFTVDSVQQPEFFKKEQAAILERKNSRKRQYLGEGATFLIVLLIGAGVVYTSIRNHNKLVRQQTNFILSITHELKSPIASIKLNLETMTKRRLEEEMQKKLMERSIVETDRLDDLCNNLLLASQMESKHFESSREQLDLSALLREHVEMHQLRSKHSISTDIEDGLSLYADPLLLRLVISNLLENALKYSPQHSEIWVRVKADEQEICLRVEDQGSGIADEEKKKIFQKFYRVGNEGSRKTKGTGLGLFLVSSIVNHLKGSISVMDNQPRGTVFEVSLPRTSASA